MMMHRATSERGEAQCAGAGAAAFWPEVGPCKRVGPTARHIAA
jgi:hypothetical protein